MKKFLVLFSVVAAVLVSCTKEVSPEISADIFSQQATAAGCEFSVNITSNAPWSVSCNYEDVTFSPGSGIGNGCVTVKVPKYLGYATKLINVTFTASSNTKSTTKTSVVITQESLPFLFCEENSITVPADETYAIFRVNSNNQWWLKDIEFTGDPFDVEVTPAIYQANPIDVVLTFPKNTTGSDRRADVILQLVNYPEITEVLTLIQTK